LVFLFHTTSFSPSFATERIADNTNNFEEDFGIDESSTKSVGELLMTTHNHILGFSFIFFFVGAIFYFNSIITDFWKMFLIIEPLISTVISFGSLLAIRFLDFNFIILTILSAVLMYSSFFVMVGVSIFELTLKNK
ncbi:MAG: hypothetical protein V3V16_04740, partial [Melioribacteraceae bacterium]